LWHPTNVPHLMTLRNTAARLGSPATRAYVPDTVISHPQGRASVSPWSTTGQLRSAQLVRWLQSPVCTAGSPRHRDFTHTRPGPGVALVNHRVVQRRNCSMTLAGSLGYRNETVFCRNAGRPSDGRSKAQCLHKSVASVRSDATRNPRSLPPICRLPGTKRLLWRAEDVESWLAAHVARSQLVGALSPVQGPSPRRGRHTKAEQVERQRRETFVHLGQGVWTQREWLWI